MAFNFWLVSCFFVNAGISKREKKKKKKKERKESESLKSIENGGELY